MKKTIFAILLGAALVLPSVQAAQVPAQAESVNGYRTAETLADTPLTDHLNRGDEKWYVYYMPATRGHVNFSLTNPNPSKNFYGTIYDSDLKDITEKRWSNTWKTYEYPFAPSTPIYIKIDSGNDGDKTDTEFTLQANFTAASDWETDYQNDQLSGADEIKANTPVYGDLLTADDVDYYKFTMPSDGKVSFKLADVDSVGETYWGIYTYDNDGKYLDLFGKNGSDFTMTTDEYYFDAGKNIYLKVDYSHHGNGVGATYELTPIFTPSKTTNTSTTDTDDSDDDSITSSVPEKVTGVKLSNVKGAKLKVRFKGQDVAAGYQIWYSYSGRQKTKKIYDKTSATISVPKGKKVSVRVRAFSYDDNNEEQYGGYSSTKIVKTDKK